MDLNPATSLTGFEPELLMRLGAAAAIGLLLGVEREYRGNAAGLRTHGIVCFTAAATTVSIINLYFQLDGDRMDPLRVFEATGAFIGIIGAGLIVFSGGKLYNITTAAHLWLAAVIGIACGAGQWPLVIVGAVIALVMMVLLRFLEDKPRRVHGPAEDDARP